MQLNSDNQNIISEEISLEYILKLIDRNKKLIVSVTFLSLFISLIYAIIKPKIWEGQFDIVLEKNNSDPIDTTNLASRVNLRTIRTGALADTTLETEIGILESPMVLMPTFNFVKSERIKLDPSAKDLLFSDWVQDLNTNLLQNTSILNITYRDTNRNLILPVLGKLSQDYQIYSGKKKRRKIKLSKDYLLNQIDLFREKSSNSIKAAQNFAIDQNLIYLGINSSKSIINSTNQDNLENFRPEYLGSIVNIEKSRVDAANRIRTINLQIKKINELSPLDYENLQYFGSSIPALAREGLPQKLKNIEERLVILRTKYTDNDIKITRLFEERKLTVNLLKERAIKYLRVSRLEAEAEMEAAMRPKGVLLKYKELMREAKNDETTLVGLENDLRSIKLEEARIEDPWQLITKPTLKERPVGFPKRFIVLNGFLLGALLGVLIAYVKEKSSKVIFDDEVLEKLLKSKIVLSYTKENRDDFILEKFLNNIQNKKISFIQIGDIDKEEYKIFQNEINKKFSSLSIDFRDLVKDIDMNRENIICCRLGFVKKEEIDKLNNLLNTFNIKLLGIICF